MDYEQVVPYIPNLRRYARALVGDRDGADDLVQDTLERAVRKFHLWRPGNLRAWLFSIMHNVFVNQVKSRRIQATGELGEDIPGANTPGWITDARDLERGLAQLPAEQREVVLMVGLEDLSYDEVSRALGVPVGTVMSRLSRGREKLRRYMDGEIARPGLKAVP
ncbi:MAG: RNA polymerase sigma factor [Burkholderiales bacterium]